MPRTPEEAAAADRADVVDQRFPGESVLGCLELGVDVALVAGEEQFRVEVPVGIDTSVVVPRAAQHQAADGPRRRGASWMCASRRVTRPSASLRSRSGRPRRSRGGWSAGSVPSVPRRAGRRGRRRSRGGTEPLVVRLVRAHRVQRLSRLRAVARPRGASDGGPRGNPAQRHAAPLEQVAGQDPADGAGGSRCQRPALRPDGAVGGVSWTGWSGTASRTVDSWPPGRGAGPVHRQPSADAVIIEPVVSAGAAQPERRAGRGRMGFAPRARPGGQGAAARICCSPVTR